MEGERKVKGEKRERRKKGDVRQNVERKESKGDNVE